MEELSPEAVREIETIHSKWIEFEIAGEPCGLMAWCAEDIELWPPDAKPLVGRAAVSAWMLKATVRIQSIEITDLSVRGSSDTAYLTANFRTTLFSDADSTPRRVFGSHLWILRKRAGSWAVALVSWSMWNSEIE